MREKTASAMPQGHLLLPQFGNPSSNLLNDLSWNLVGVGQAGRAGGRGEASF